MLIELEVLEILIFSSHIKHLRGEDFLLMLLELVLLFFQSR